VVGVSTLLKKTQKLWQKPGHCGPASVAMLFSAHGVILDQEIIMQNTGVMHDKTNEGTRIDQLSLSIQKLKPNYVLLAKYNATVKKIDELIREFSLPVGVEWQGGFVDANQTYFEEGHYSVITKVDYKNKVIKLLDPDPSSLFRDGVIPIDEFKRRWWEENVLPTMGDANKNIRICHIGLLFVIVHKNKESNLLRCGLSHVTPSFLIENQCTLR
jgi:hypothetical protein